MFCLDWLHAGRSTRGKPRRKRHWCRSLPAMGLLACLALLQSGCQSGPFAHCGDGSKLFGPCGFFSRTSARVFNRPQAANCCEPGIVSDGTVVDAVPSAVVTPGVVPSYSSGARVVNPPGSTDSSTELGPAGPVDPTAKSRVVTPPGNGASRTGPQGASYQTRSQDSGTRIARRRNENNIKTTVTTPEPTAGSAQVPSRAASGSRSAGEPDPLDNIPPFDLPGDAPRSSSTPPVPPPAAARPAAEPAQAGKSAANKPDPKADTLAAEASEVELTSINLPAPEPATSASVGPGLARFLAVDLKLAGGSLPSTAGLDWLVEKGYRTLLDLRESGEVQPSFIAEATKRGLRYIALPIGPGSIDREHVARFAFEVAAAEARPLYFFDSDGTRSGALWYIRRHRHRPCRRASRATRSRRARVGKQGVLVRCDPVRLHAASGSNQLDG